MLLTILLAVLIMLGLFLLLYAGVALSQDKKYFTTAPKEVQAIVEPKPERFRGQHVLGYILAILAILLMLGAFIYGLIDGVNKDFSFWQFFLRFSLMLLLVKLYDIIFFDWYLLCRSNFFTHYYPEGKGILGPHLFGFNKKDHLIQTIIILIGSALLAGICTLF